MSDQITYDNKVDLQVATNVANINKVTASDMNEIKNVVNSHADDIDELNAPEKWVSVGTTAPTDGRRVWFEKSVNLINPSLLPLTESGVTISQNSNGDIVLNGTPTITYGYISFIITDYFYLDVGEYTLSVRQKMNGIGVNCGHAGFNGAINLTLSGSERTKTATLSSRSGGDVRVNVRYDVGTLTNFILNPQLQKGSTASDYEPYIEEKSIKVDNEDFISMSDLVSVGANQPSDGKRVWFPKGKNLFDGQLELGSYGGSGERTSATNIYRNTNAIFVSPNTTYTFSINGTTQKYVVLFYDINKNYISQNSSLTTGTFTTPNNTYFVNFRSFLADFVSDFANLKVQLEEGSTATAYEQYVTPSIKVDGNEIYNLKLQTPQKITLSFNTTYVYETDLDYTCFRLGKLVFLFINTLAFRVGAIADFPNYSIIISGLPRPAQTKIFYLQPSGNFNRFRADVTSVGNMQRHWSADPSYGDSSNKQYSGFIVYETID